jgi:hypothetical protein
MFVLFTITIVPIPVQLAIFYNKSDSRDYLGSVFGYIQPYLRIPGTLYRSLFHPLSIWGLLESSFPVATPLKISKPNMREADCLLTSFPNFLVAICRSPPRYILGA